MITKTETNQWSLKSSKSYKGLYWMFGLVDQMTYVAGLPKEILPMLKQCFIPSAKKWTSAFGTEAPSYIENKTGWAWDSISVPITNYTFTYTNTPKT